MIADEFNPDRVNAALRRLRELQPARVTFNLDQEVNRATKCTFGYGVLSPAEIEHLHRRMPVEGS